VTPRGKALVLILVGAAWMILGLVNLAKGRSPIGILYVIIGAILALSSLAIQRGRRSR
jgi:hypothetical protein